MLLFLIKNRLSLFLDELSDEAKQIGAVNTVKVLADGRRKGFNTDAFGFEKTLLAHKKDYHTSSPYFRRRGAAKAVKYVLISIILLIKQFPGSRN